MKLSFYQIRDQVNNILREHGIGQGDALQVSFKIATWILSERLGISQEIIRNVRKLNWDDGVGITELSTIFSLSRYQINEILNNKGI
jgi:hypothetical protein